MTPRAAVRLWIKVASARLMLRNVNVSSTAGSVVNSSKVTRCRRGASAASGHASRRGGSSLLPTHPAPHHYYSPATPGRPLSATRSSLSATSNRLRPAGYPRRKVPPGRSFSWGTTRPHRRNRYEKPNSTNDENKVAGLVTIPTDRAASSAAAVTTVAINSEREY